MENLTLEQELLARIFLHKVSIVGGVLMKEFIARESQSPIKLPPFQMEQQADLYSDSIIQKAMAEGTFDKLYNESWDKVKNIIPEHMCIISE